LKVAGKDGTQDFEAIHSIDILKQLPPSAFKGTLRGYKKTNTRKKNYLK